MVDKANRIFESEKGKETYGLFKSAIADYDMIPYIKRGVLLGLSGGADSVLLLLLLLKLRQEYHFNILAVHINHMIRGEEADRDEFFSRGLCEMLGVEFLSFSIDVPMLAKAAGKGVEETAREARYSKFSEIISSRNDIKTVAVAHNATDNLETIIFNIMRGSGTRGASGIAPRRDNIVRPMIYVAKDSVVSLLSDNNISYVIDSSNESLEYTRNYIRNNIVPHMRAVTKSAEEAATRLSRNLRRDDQYITSVARKFIDERVDIKKCQLDELDAAVLSRVLRLMCDDESAMLEEVHIQSIKSMLGSDNFKVSLPGNQIFLCEYGICKVVSGLCDKINFFSKLTYGVNEFKDLDADILLGDTKFDISSLNVYKFSIQANLSSAIIKGDLFVRSKKDGDTIFYGGHRKKLKKIFNDLKIPPSIRSSIAIVCDDDGVVWVPGVAVRDDNVSPEERKDLYIALGIGKSDILSERRMRSLSEFRI